IATALVAFLVQRRPQGVVRLETVVADDNPASLALLKRIGPAEITRRQGAHEVRIELDEEQLARIAADAPVTDEAANAEALAEAGTGPSRPARRRRRHRLPHEVLQLDKLFLDWLPLRVPSDTASDTASGDRE